MQIKMPFVATARLRAALFACLGIGLARVAPVDSAAGISPGSAALARYEQVWQAKKEFSAAGSGRARISKRAARRTFPSSAPTGSIRDWMTRNRSLLGGLQLRVAREIHRRREIYFATQEFIRGLPGCSAGVSRGDFNGDGFADLAIGMPGEDASATIPDSGAVIVLYGSRNGLVAVTAASLGVPAPQYFSQATSGISGVNESVDRFGAALAAGEFNGDDYSDLAIGVPGEDIPFEGRSLTNAGRVVILYGSPAGLAASGPNRILAPQSVDLSNHEKVARSISGDQQEIFVERAEFGSSLAWGDFDADGAGDLAVGAPRMNVRHHRFGQIFPDLFPNTETGGVFLFRGRAGAGLNRIASDRFFPPISMEWFVEVPVSNFIEHRSERRDVDTTGFRFGASLAALQFDGVYTFRTLANNVVSEQTLPGTLDLAVGMPGATVFVGPDRFVRNAGAVHVFPGHASPNEGQTPRFFSPYSILQVLEYRLSEADSSGDFPYPETLPGIRIRPFLGPAPGGSNFPQPGDRFGASLAAFRSVLAVGVPGQSRRERRLTNGTFELTDRRAGGVHLFSHTFPSLHRFVTQDSLFGAGRSEAGDEFGFALAFADSGADTPELAIGVPGEDLAAGVDSGEVNLMLFFRGLPPRDTNLSPVRILPERSQAGAQFGRNLSSWDFGRGAAGLRDLAVGSPFRDVNGVRDAGSVSVFYGSPNARGTRRPGITMLNSQEWTQDAPGVPSVAGRGDNFGGALY